MSAAPTLSGRWLAPTLTNPGRERMAVIIGTAGDDVQLVGWDGEADTIFGDRRGTVAAVGGDDRIFGLGRDDLLVGDSLGVAVGARGGDDELFGGDGSDAIYGDARLSLRGTGGDDTLLAGAAGAGRQVLYGDAFTLFPGSRGGNDRLEGGQEMAGDGADLRGAVAGRDVVDARDVTAGADIRLYGDGLGAMSDGSLGGVDVLWASARGARLVGDAVAIRDTSRGGDDYLRGDAGDDVLFGDAGQALTGAARGGDDVLRGRAGDDELFGDALELRGSSRGGDDQLYSGAGDDRLWGDGRLFGDAEGGDDVFHFAGAFGDDRVLDFRRGEDQLAFTDLLPIDVSVDTVGGNKVVAALAGDSVTLLDFTGPLTFGKDILFFG
jgi:hypothetical protein